MNNIIFALSESDKRFLFAFIMALVIIFVLIGYLGYLVTRIMKYQGKKLENHVFDVVTTRVITDKKHFVRYAFKKNNRVFFKESWIPIVIMIASSLVLLLYDIIYGNFAYNPFNIDDGFGTLFFLWKLDDPELWTTVLGIPVMSKFPELLRGPIWVWKAWGSYIFVPGMTVGLIWYLVTVQAYIARLIHTSKLKDSIFSKNLDGFNQNQQLYSSLGMQNMQQNNNIQNNSNNIQNNNEDEKKKFL